MKHTGTPMRTLALLLVTGLAVGSLIAGIVRAADPATPPVPASANRRSIIVSLQLNSNGDVTGVSQPVSDDQQSKGKEVGLSKKQGHYAEWITYPPWVDVDLSIGMKANSPYPFDGPFQASGNRVSSAKVLKDAKEGKYDYWVSVHDKKTGKDFRLDPPIRVDP